MTAAPTFKQIRAQVAAIRKKDPDARVFGIEAAGRWTGPAVQTHGDETYRIVQCGSPLAMRVALQEDTPDVTAKVLLTDLPKEQIDSDILVRVARRKFRPIHNWQIIRELFQARYIDPRIAEQGWIAELLLDLAPLEGYPPVPSGVLDAETVWGILLEQQMGLAVARPDLIGLLKWSMEREIVERFKGAAEAFRRAAAEWIEQSAGPATRAVLSCAEANERPDALPVGLALGVIFSKDAAGELDRAAGRIEKYVGETRLSEQVAQRWAAAADEVVRLHMPNARARATWLQRADEILEAVEGDSHAFLSSTSPRGFSQRLARYGQALSSVVDTHTTEVPEPVNEAFRHVADHAQTQWDQGSRQLQRVEMSARLLRWLVRQRRDEALEPGSLVEAAHAHGLAGGFVDWARYSLRGGEQVRELSEAYAGLLTQVERIREQQNRQFAKLLRDWTAAGSAAEGVIPVERVLAEVVAPLAAHAPVLVLVIDGMSFAVFRELVEAITRQDWVEIRREDRGPIWPAIAALPSLTEACRTSLLCGKLRRGQAGDEKAGFAEHPELLPHCRGDSPPKLFHKDALQGSDEATPATNVIKAIESSHRRIVGVIINAVDDHLLKGDQLDIRWTGEQIKILPTLLYEAKSAGRLVVMLSDHGHVLDCHSQCRQGDGGDRWRKDNGSPAEDEVQIAGERVVLPADHRLIAPWSENVRYSMKKNGYHGGVTMQEMIVPVAVLSARQELPEGWSEPPVDTPAWWFAPLEKKAPVEEPVVQVAKPSRKKPAGMLFDLREAEEPTAAAPATIPAPEWLDRLFQSPILAEQKKLGGRAIPSDDVFARLLTVLSEQGGKMTSAALAHRMQWPPFRLRGLLAAIQRVLNVEGYPILTRDETSDTVELNRRLLCRQFEIG